VLVDELELCDVLELLHICRVLLDDTLLGDCELISDLEELLLDTVEYDEDVELELDDLVELVELDSVELVDQLVADELVLLLLLEVVFS
jgi:hypothetical protein